MTVTRLELEAKLEKKYLGRIVTFCTIHNKDITGKIHRIAAEFKNNEAFVIFVLNHTRYECDIVYFIENITLHGNTPGTDTGDPGV